MNKSMKKIEKEKLVLTSQSDKCSKLPKYGQDLCVTIKKAFDPL